MCKRDRTDQEAYQTKKKESPFEHLTPPPLNQNRALALNLSKDLEQQ
jgi:hypothetical protein